MISTVGVEKEHLVAGYRSSSRPEVMDLLPSMKQDLKVLEIGCGEGLFCSQVPGARETWGIEPDLASAEVAKGRLSKVLVGIFDETRKNLPEHHFDLVVCNDVIEHMTDHDGFLSSIRRYMAPGAYLVGSLPNVRFHGNLFNLVVARDWHYQNSGILDRTHFRFFTFRSARRCLEENGFDVRRLEGINKGSISGWTGRDLIQRLFRAFLIAASGGAARDVRYHQLGFLAVPVTR